MNEGGYNTPSDYGLDFSQYHIAPPPPMHMTPSSTSLMGMGMGGGVVDSTAGSSSSPFFSISSVGVPQWYHQDPPLLFSSAATASYLTSSAPALPLPLPLPLSQPPHPSLPYLQLAAPPTTTTTTTTPTSTSLGMPHLTFKKSPPSTPSPPTAPPSIPSPPSTPSPPQSTSTTSVPPAKRKRTTKEDLMKVNTGIQWEDYIPPDTTFIQLLDSLAAMPPFGIQVGHIDKNAIVETEKCIIYRQNQFKLQCTLSGSLHKYTTPLIGMTANSKQQRALIGSLDGRLFEIEGLYFKMYAFKQNGDEATEEFKVPIHQVGPSRTKKETKPPEVIPISNGGGFFDKLQFQASTHVGSECYFRIVVTLVAKTHEKYYVVSAKISPKLLVRAQNPGRYNPNNPANLKLSTHTIPTTTWHTHNNNSPPSDNSNEEYDEQPTTPSTPDPTKTSWIQSNDVLYYYGRVGINTENPHEALSVNGNIMVTGDIYKPSDKRLKQNFASVNPATQLNAINKINIYDYDIQAGDNLKRERGVIAQEVAQVLPAAVQRLGNYTTGNGQTIDNLLVVNERVLLMENIGATQYLDKVVKEEREELNHVNNKVEELEEEERKKSSYVMKTIQNMGSLIMSEDFREAPRSEWIYCGFSICGLGPAWSVFVMGFFFTPAWFLGSLYVSSRNPIKRAAGIANILMLFVVAFMVAAMVFVPEHNTPLRALVSCVIIIGVIFLAAVSYYKRKRERLRQKVLKNNLREVIGRQ